MPADRPESSTGSRPETSTGSRPEAPSRRVLRLALLLCGLGVALYTATRLLHPIRGIGNADIAGILYEADIIRDGGLPYVDTHDFKSPGTFFIVAAIFRLISREYWAVQAIYFVWGLLAAPSLWLAARLLYGRGDAGTLAAGAAVFLYLLSFPLFDLNYSGWMAPAYAWACTCLLLGLHGHRRWHALAGVWAGAAVLLKVQAIVLAPAFVSLWLWARWRRWPGATWHAWPLWLIGAELTFLPLMILYGLHGALPQLLGGVFPIEFARAYGQRIQPETHWLLIAAWKVPHQIGRVFPLLTWLGLAAIAGAAWQARRARTGRSEQGLSDMVKQPAPIAPQLILFAWSVVGCGLGGLRYYIHYLPQYIPSLALLAAHPAAYRWSFAQARHTRIATLVVLLVAGLQFSRDLITLARGKAARVDFRGNSRAEEVGTYIREHTHPDECIQVWGWSAWSVYYWSDRRACTPMMKVLGQITDANQNSLLTRSKSADFIPGENADIMLAGIRARPPAFFLRTSPFFPGVKKDPLEQFTELHTLFKEQYVLRRRFGRMSLFEHISRIPAEEVAELRSAAAKKPKPKPKPKAKAKAKLKPNPAPDPAKARP